MRNFQDYGKNLWFADNKEAILLKLVIILGFWLSLAGSNALGGFVAFDNGGSTWIAVTYDDRELARLANGSEMLLCEGSGWAAAAQYNPAYGGDAGYVCGGGTRDEAERAALETCPGNCQLMWSGYDDDTTVRNIENGHTSLKNRIFY